MKNVQFLLHKFEELFLSIFQTHQLERKISDNKYYFFTKRKYHYNYFTKSLATFAFQSFDPTILFTTFQLSIDSFICSLLGRSKIQEFFKALEKTFFSLLIKF